MSKENKNTPKLSVITVNWNGLEYLKKCVDAIQKYTKDYELIIIDNNSDDGSIEYLENLDKKNENVMIAFSDENLGWVKGINKGLEHVKGEYICFLNNDIEVVENWFENMSEHFNDPEEIKVGAVGCTTNFTMGLQRNDFNKLVNGNHHKVNYLIGWLILTKRDVLVDVANHDKYGEPKINGMAGLDPIFGIGSSDDLDISLRIKRAGYELFIAREVNVYHHGSKSFEKLFEGDIKTKGTDANKAYMEDVDKKLDILREKWGKDTVKELLTISIPQPNFEGTIGIPHGDKIPHKFHTDLLALRGIQNLKLIHIYGSLVQKARNDVVEGLAGDWLLFIDSDMTFPNDSLEKILKTAERKDVDIVSAPCFRKVPAFEPCWFWKVPNEIAKDKYYRELEWDESKPFEIDACGMAFCLIKKKVFEKMREKSKAPYFEYTNELSEDLMFCKKAKELGFKIWIDPSLNIGHLTMLPINSMVFKGSNAKNIETWKKQKEECGENPTIHELRNNKK